MLTKSWVFLLAFTWSVGLSEWARPEALVVRDAAAFALQTGHVIESRRLPGASYRLIERIKYTGQATLQALTGPDARTGFDVWQPNHDRIDFVPEALTDGAIATSVENGGPSVNYALRGQIGRGHMGEVWRAQQLINGEPDPGAPPFVLKRVLSLHPAALLSGWREVHFGELLCGIEGTGRPGTHDERHSSESHSHGPSHGRAAGQRPGHSSSPFVARYIEHFVRNVTIAAPVDDNGKATGLPLSVLELWLVFRDEGVSLQRLLYSTAPAAAAASEGQSKRGRAQAAGAAVPGTFWIRMRTSSSGRTVYRDLFRQLMAGLEEVHGEGQEHGHDHEDSSGTEHTNGGTAGHRGPNNSQGHRRSGIYAHRDIKPGNIMVGVRSEGEDDDVQPQAGHHEHKRHLTRMAVRLADFGSAVDERSVLELYPASVAEPSSGSGGTGSTGDGRASSPMHASGPTAAEATLPYAPPEVSLSWDGRPYHPRAPWSYDSWSAGVTMLETLLGQTPGQFLELSQLLGERTAAIVNARLAAAFPEDSGVADGGNSGCSNGHSGRSAIDGWLPLTRFKAAQLTASIAALCLGPGNATLAPTSPAGVGPDTAASAAHDVPMPEGAAGVWRTVISALTAATVGHHRHGHGRGHDGHGGLAEGTADAAAHFEWSADCIGTREGFSRAVRFLSARAQAVADSAEPGHTWSASAAADVHSTTDGADATGAGAMADGGSVDSAADGSSGLVSVSGLGSLVSNTFGRAIATLADVLPMSITGSRAIEALVPAVVPAAAVVNADVAVALELAPVPVVGFGQPGLAAGRLITAGLPRSTSQDTSKAVGLLDGGLSQQPSLESSAVVPRPVGAMTLTRAAADKALVAAFGDGHAAMAHGRVTADGSLAEHAVASVMDVGTCVPLSGNPEESGLATPGVPAGPATPDQCSWTPSEGRQDSDNDGVGPRAVPQRAQHGTSVPHTAAAPPRSLDEPEPLLGLHGEDLLWRVLAWNPEDRLTAAQALEHPYLQQED